MYARRAQVRSGTSSFDEHKNLVERYDKGRPPYDDISDEEAFDRYRELVMGLSEVDYQRSALKAFSTMAPEERVEFGRQLRDQRTSRVLASRTTARKSTDSRPRTSWRGWQAARATITQTCRKPLQRRWHGLMGDALGDGVTGGEGAWGG